MLFFGDFVEGEGGRRGGGAYAWFGEEGEEPGGMDYADGGAGLGHGWFLEVVCMVCSRVCGWV